MPEWLKVLNRLETKSSEVLLYGEIGDSFWDENAKSFAQFREEWNTIPKDHEISLRVNSPGGSVWDGIPIYNLIRKDKDRVTAYVEGIAASIASVIVLAAKRVVMPGQGELFVHEPWSGASGDSAVMQSMAERLNFLGDQIADIYAEKTGKTRNEMRDIMKANGIGTSFLGSQAKEIGLVDEITSDAPAKNSFDLSRFRHLPVAVTGGVLPPPKAQKQKEPQSMTETNQTAPTAEALPAPVAVIDPAEFAKVKNQLDAERKARIETQIKNIAATRDFDVAEWLPRAVADETVLASLAKLPERGAAPVRPIVEAGDTEPSEPKNEKDAGERLVALRDNPVAAARFYRNHKAKCKGSLTGPRNANTFTTLTHTVLSQQTIEAFTYTLQPLNAFSRNFSAEAAQKGDKVKVLFTAAADAPYDWTGSYTVQAAAATGNEITIDKRKVVSWGLTTEEIMTQPLLSLETFAIQKGNALGLAVVQDVFSLVTKANYGSNAITTVSTGGDFVAVAAANFSVSEEIAWLYAACGKQNWPEFGRSMVLSVPYYANLLGVSEVIGTGGINGTSSSVIKEAELPRVMKFDVYETNAISATATDNVTGFVAIPDGILIAMRAMLPEGNLPGTPNNRTLTDPGTGATIVMREWFTPNNDQAIRTLECCYGRRVGNAKGVKLIVSS